MKQELLSLCEMYSNETMEMWPEDFEDDLRQIELPFTTFTHSEYKAFDSTNDSPVFFRVVFKWTEEKGWGMDNFEVNNWTE